MKISASVTDVIRNFADYINRVVYRGERFLLIRGGKPVAELGPVPVGTRVRELPELLESLPRLTSSDADAFLKDLDTARSELHHAGLRDAWDS